MRSGPVYQQAKHNGRLSAWSDFASVEKAKSRFCQLDKYCILSSLDLQTGKVRSMCVLVAEYERVASVCRTCQFVRTCGFRELRVWTKVSSIRKLERCTLTEGVVTGKFSVCGCWNCRKSCIGYLATNNTIIIDANDCGLLQSKYYVYDNELRKRSLD